jgi:hypothetical protein
MIYCRGMRRLVAADSVNFVCMDYHCNRSINHKLLRQQRFTIRRLFTCPKATRALRATFENLT